MRFTPGVYVHKSMISKSIDYNNGTITSAKITATWTGNGNIQFFLSANGGANWEQVTNLLLSGQSKVTHTFTNTGTDLRWKILAAGINITELVISDYH